MKRVGILVLLIVLMFVFSTCVAGPNTLEKTPNKDGKVAGFWYNFGFVLGAGLFLSGGILGKRKRKKRKY